MQRIYDLIGMAVAVTISFELSLWLGRRLVDCLLRSLTKS
jgi:hypothetical protein